MAKFALRLLLTIKIVWSLQTSDKWTELETPPSLETKRIVCPVLAAMVTGGDLHPDAQGSITLTDIYNGLVKGLWTEKKLAVAQATGIADYALDQKEIQQHRNRCIPGSPCWLKRQIRVTNQTERWLNIYKMNGMQSQEHGFSTGVRGGATNVPSFDLCAGGVYPCEDRFQRFYAPCAEKETQRFYWSNLQCVLCNAWSHGDKGGEFAYNPTQKGQQWQEAAAVNGFVRAFGRSDDGKPDAYNGIDKLYFTMDDIRALLMEGRYPDDWGTDTNPKREWGSVTDFPKMGMLELPCAGEDGYNPPWWSDSDGCTSSTGDTCWRDGNCIDGASCILGRCTCGQGANLLGMCFQNGKCVERKDECVYFGEPCTRVAADNPSAPW